MHNRYNNRRSNNFQTNNYSRGGGKYYGRGNYKPYIARNQNSNTDEQIDLYDSFEQLINKYYKNEIAIHWAIMNLNENNMENSKPFMEIIKILKWETLIQIPTLINAAKVSTQEIFNTNNKLQLATFLKKKYELLKLIYMEFTLKKVELDYLKENKKIALKIKDIFKSTINKHNRNKNYENTKNKMTHYFDTDIKNFILLLNNKIRTKEILLTCEYLPNQYLEKYDIDIDTILVACYDELDNNPINYADEIMTSTQNILQIVDEIDNQFELENNSNKNEFVLHPIKKDIHSQSITSDSNSSANKTPPMNKLTQVNKRVKVSTTTDTKRPKKNIELNKSNMNMDNIFNVSQKKNRETMVEDSLANIEICTLNKVLSPEQTNINIVSFSDLIENKKLLTPLTTSPLSLTIDMNTTADIVKNFATNIPTIHNSLDIDDTKEIFLVTLFIKNTNELIPSLAAPATNIIIYMDMSTFTHHFGIITNLFKNNILFEIYLPNEDCINISPWNKIKIMINKYKTLDFILSTPAPYKENLWELIIENSVSENVINNVTDIMKDITKMKRTGTRNHFYLLTLINNNDINNTLNKITQKMMPFGQKTPIYRTKDLFELHTINCNIITDWLINNNSAPTYKFTKVSYNFKKRFNRINKEKFKYNKNKKFFKLKNFLKNKKILCIPSDKSGKLTFLQQSSYTKAAFKHLNDKKTYKKLTQAENDGIDFEMKEYLKEKNLLPKEYYDRKFFILPKTLKDISEWPNPPWEPRHRPIVSDTKSITDLITKKHLKKLQNIQNESQYICTNSLQIINSIKEIHKKKLLNSYSSIYMVTADIESLYTNIDLIDLLKIIDVHSPESTELTDDLRRIILNNNFYAKEANSFYLQTYGLPIGSRLSGVLANIFLTSKENSIIKKYNENILIYKRYVDDVFCLFNGNLCLLKQFLNELKNNFKLNLTCNISMYNNIFLDLNIFLINKKFIIKPFGKNTYPIINIPFESDHRNEKFTISIINMQLLRIWRISNNLIQFNNFLQEIRSQKLNKKMKVYIDIFFINTRIKKKFYKHKHLLCEECKKILKQKNIHMEKSFTINNITIASKIPFNCKNENIIVIEFNIQNKLIILHTTKSLELDIHVWQNDNILLPYNWYNDKNYAQCYEKIKEIEFKIIHNKLNNPKLNYRPHIHNIFNNNKKVYDFSFPLFKYKTLQNYINH